MSPLQLLAHDVGVNERTLRRAVTQGTLRASRPSPRTLEIPLTELEYVRRSWPVISLLRSALRTEHNVGFALLFGSCALGTDGPDSDVDVLVSLHEPDLMHLIDLKTRLSEVLGRDVDIVLLDQAEREPVFLAQALDEGRVLVDRDRRWTGLSAQKGRLLRRGSSVDAQRIRDALAGIDRLLAA